MLKIDEITGLDGELEPVSLEVVEGALHVVHGGRPLPLPPGALEAVMGRFGGPLDPAERITRVASLELGAGRVLWHVRHLSGYDVVARDYLVYESSDQEPRCALGVTVAAALLHLARAHLQASGRSDRVSG